MKEQDVSQSILTKPNLCEGFYCPHNRMTVNIKYRQVSGVLLTKTLMPLWDKATAAQV